MSSLEYLQGWWSCSVSGQLVPLLDHRRSILQWNFMFQLVPTASCSFTCSSLVRRVWFHLQTLLWGIYTHWQALSWAFSSPSWALVLLPCVKWPKPLIIFMDFCWTHPISCFYWGVQKWTQHSGYELTSVNRGEGSPPSHNVLAALFLTQCRMLLAFKGMLLSHVQPIEHQDPYLKSCFLPCQSTSLSCCVGTDQVETSFPGTRPCVKTHLPIFGNV